MNRPRFERVENTMDVLECNFRRNCMIPAPASGVLCWEVEFHHLLAGHGEKPPRNRPSTYIVSIKIGYVVPTFYSAPYSRILSRNSANVARQSP